MAGNALGFERLNPEQSVSLEKIIALEVAGSGR
jgi:hypothetical protein